MPTAAEDKKPQTDTETQSQLTDQEIEELASKASNVLFGPPTEKARAGSKEKDAAADKAAAEAKAKEEAARKAADEKAKAEADLAKKAQSQKGGEPQAQQARPGPTADEIAERVAQRMAPKATESKPDELSPDDKASREVLEFMARENPEYGRLLKQFDAFIPAEKSYRETWQKANPSKTYDPADTEHEDFYSANDPIQTEEDQEAFDRASNRLEARKTAETIVSEKEQERARQEAVRTVTGKLKSHDAEITSELIRAVDPELGKIDLKKRKLRDEDPLAEAAVRPYLPALAAMTAELVKAFTPGLNYQFRDDNPLHTEIVRSIYGYENELLKLPSEQQLADDGRRLAAIEDYNKMSPAEKAKHWTIWMEPNAVRALLVRDFAAKAREDLTLYRSKSGKPEKGSAESGARKQPDPKPKEEASSNATKQFPNTGGGAEGGATFSGGDNFNGDDAKTITKSLFG